MTDPRPIRPAETLGYGPADDQHDVRAVVFRALGIAGILVAIQRIAAGWAFGFNALMPVAAMMSSRRPSLPPQWREALQVAICVGYLLLLGALLASSCIRLLLGSRRGFALMRWNELAALVFFTTVDVLSFFMSYGNFRGLPTSAAALARTPFATVIIMQRLTPDLVFPLVVVCLFSLRRKVGSGRSE